MPKSQSRARNFRDPDENITVEQDPEALAGNSGSDDSDADSDDPRTGTEHYVDVGKSKLRQKENVSLGPKYKGARISRADLEARNDEEDDDDDDDDEDASESDYADPDLVDLEADEAEASDSEIPSDDALGESDVERFKDFAFRASSKPSKPPKGKGQRAKASDYMSSSDDEALDGGATVTPKKTKAAAVDLPSSDEDDEDEDMDDGLDDLADGGADSEENLSGDGTEEDDEDEDDEESGSEGEDEKLTNGGGKVTAQAQGPSAQPDVQKGLAIQKQRSIYDGLLNLRIRLQKALVASNTLHTVENTAEADPEPYEAAEQAAVNLLNTISSLKANVGPPERAGSKRKRGIEASMETAEIWDQLQQEEKKYIKFRADRLEKWSKKVQSVNVTTSNGLGPKKKTLVDSLQEQLIDPDSRLVKRTKVPRSCAPVQAAKHVQSDDGIYDDADFYQLLLKELVDQRTVETTTEQASAVPTVMLTAAKEAKVRKNVDRKASKGRKMRFTVHEKLQNFMAPEDRRAWEAETIDRFFGTMFGRRMELNEEESGDEEMDDMLANEDGGIQLFQN